MDYYNDFDKSAVEWLGRLVRRGTIPAGKIDSRDVRSIEAQDLTGFRRVHLFAGIGGWADALRRAGWPEDRPVWTGSCPCQPYSSGGRRLGDADPRNMWPEFRRLIEECRPPEVFGEQTASPDGCRWLAGVRSDLEAIGYAFGASDLCAAGVGAPHRRQRLYWVANANRERFSRGQESNGETVESKQQASRRADPVRRRVGMEYAAGKRALLPGAAEPKGHWANHGVPVASGPWDQFALVRCPSDGRLRRLEPGIEPVVDGFPGRVGLIRGYGNGIVPELAAEFIGSYLDLDES